MTAIQIIHLHSQIFRGLLRCSCLVTRRYIHLYVHVYFPLSHWLTDCCFYWRKALFSFFFFLYIFFYECENASLRATTRTVRWRKFVCIKQWRSSTHHRDQHCRYPSTARQGLSPLRRRCLRCRASTSQGTRVAQKVLQVQGLHQDPRLYNRLWRSRQGCLLQNLLRKEMGTPRLRFRLWFWFSPDRWSNVSQIYIILRSVSLAMVRNKNNPFHDPFREDEISAGRPFFNPDTTSIKAPAGQGCPRCGGMVFAAEQQLAKGTMWHKKCFNCAECHRPLDSMLACDGPDKEIHCRSCYGKLFGPKGFGFGHTPTLVSTNGDHAPS